MNKEGCKVDPLHFFTIKLHCGWWIPASSQNASDAIVARNVATVHGGRLADSQSF